MSDICPVCSLPKDLCVCDTIKKEEQKITIKIVKRRFGKLATLIEGIEDLDLKEIAKELKSKLACGGTSKKGAIELQGDHSVKAKKILEELGFTQGSIKIEKIEFRRR